jgi:pyruvate,water dikinase
MWIKDVFDLLCRLEQLFGSPQDLEWTHTGTSLIALQSRPITTLSSVDDDERQYYLTLRRTLKNLLELRDEIENVVIPNMLQEAADLAGTDLRKLSDEELSRELDRRLRILQNWENVYKDKCIPFAHSMRLFAEVYNQQVRPEDPFEFMKVLGRQQLLSLKRNTLIQRIADLLENDPESLECLYRQDVLQCRSDVIQLVTEFQTTFADSAWESESLFGNSARIAKLISSYLEKHSKKSSSGDDTSQILANRYLDAFPDRKKEYAATLLDVARAGYRLRDDDNIYLGKIRRQVFDAQREACSRGLVDSEIECLSSNEVADSSTAKDLKPSNPLAGDEIFEVHTRQVVGQPAGPGLGTGKARIIESPDDLFEFRADEILVCDAIDPNMTFIVPLAAGIVERRGGMLIHGAIIAREYGIPCVTGVPEATRIIRTGETVTVDGFLGIVIIG